MTTSARKLLRDWLEVSLVISLTLLPAWWVGSSSIEWSPSCLVTYGGLILKSVQMSVLVLLVIWISGERWSDFGITSIRMPRDAVNGIALYCADIGLSVMFAFVYIVAGGAPVGRSVFTDLPRAASTFDWLLVVCLCIIAGMSEELLVRGYLLTRLEKLLRSSVAAIVVSGVMFGLAHSYKQPIGVLVTILSGVLFGFCFVRWRRLCPLIIAHGLMDLTAFALLSIRHR